MKRIRQSLVITLFSIAALCSGCKNDLLDTSPYGSISSGNMWSTDNLTDLGAAGVYEALRLGMDAGSSSDLELYQFDRLVTGQKKGTDAFMVSTLTTGNGVFANMWQNLYEGVHRSNDAILNIKVKSPSEEKKKARLIAEMKFLRAYYYFRLNQLYKGVPVYLEPVTVEETNRARATEDEVWEVILTDLTDCINEENLPAKYTKGNADFGRATKSAAYALRGKVYMYRQQWDLAIADFQQVKAAGHTLFPDYRTLFLEENEQSDEMIFSIQNMPVNGFGSTTHFFCGTRSAFGSCWNSYLVHPDVVEACENKDGSPFSWNDIIPGYNEMPAKQREVFFLRNRLTDKEIANCKAKGLDMSYYLPDGNEARIRKAYDNRDPRLEANVITPYASYLGRAIDGADRIFTSRWPFRQELLPTLDLATDTKTLFYYLYRKFVYTGTKQLPNRTAGGIDFPIIRYADVLLLLAEALNERNRTDEAIALVNDVRRRAGVGLLNSSPTTMVTGQEDLRKRIRHEKRVEFINEGVIYFEELRWKSWKQTSFYQGSGTKEIWGSVKVPYQWQGDELYAWPIPQAEMERNRNLGQNPGWIK